MYANVDLMKRNVIQVNGGITINVDVSVKNVMYVNSATGSCENEKDLASIMGDSAIMCDEIISADMEAKSNEEAKSNDEETKT